MAPTRTASDSKTPYKDILSSLSTGIKKTTSRVDFRAVDLDKCCGVAVDTGSPCPKPLRDCQTHSRVQKRAVAGRSCSYDMLIIAPAFNIPTSFKKEVQDNGEGSSTGASKADRKGVNHIYAGEWNPPVKGRATKTESPERKGRATTADAEMKSVKGEDMDTAKDVKEEKTPPAKVATRARGLGGKKRGPKSWTALENDSK